MIHFPVYLVLLSNVGLKCLQSSTDPNSHFTYCIQLMQRSVYSIYHIHPKYVSVEETERERTPIS